MVVKSVRNLVRFNALRKISMILHVWI